MDAFFYEAFAEEAESLRRHLGDSISFEMTPKTIQEFGAAVPPARLITIRTQSKIPAAWATQIDGVLSRSTGYDHLRAYRDSISVPLPCGYLDEYATRAVAEHAIITMISLFRRFPKQLHQFPQFDRDGLTGSEFGGKKILVVGVGRIGSEIVQIARGVGMHVAGVDLVHRHDGIQYMDRMEGMRWADVIVCAMNQTKENRHYFNEALLRQTRPGVLFVNIARGDIVKTSDLLRLLKEGHVAGAALDVFENEPEVADALRAGCASSVPSASMVQSLLSHPNVILTPHNAFNTREALERKSEFTVRQVKHFLATKDFLWRIE